jgi:predicted transcriptional regulator
VTAILLSVRPTFARALLIGTKTAEVRRRFPDQPEGTELFIYSSNPDRAVVGTVQLDSIDRPQTEDVWGLYRDQIEIAEGPLNEYLDEVQSAAILRISAPRRWSREVPLAELRQRICVEPPQSFRYLDDIQARALRELGMTRITNTAPSTIVAMR